MTRTVNTKMLNTQSTKPGPIGVRGISKKKPGHPLPGLWGAGCENSQYVLQKARKKWKQNQKMHIHEVLTLATTMSSDCESSASDVALGPPIAQPDLEFKVDLTNAHSANVEMLEPGNCGPIFNMPLQHYVCGTAHQRPSSPEC